MKSITLAFIDVVPEKKLVSLNTSIRILSPISLFALSKNNTSEYNVLSVYSVPAIHLSLKALNES